MNFIINNKSSNVLEISNDNQLISILYLKDELMHVYDEMKYAKDIDEKAFVKIKNRLERLNQLIESYLKK